jgi:long-subunit fatty acid transport protein
MANNTYEGGLRDIAITTDAGPGAITEDQMPGTLSDKEVDATQTGSGFGMIAGVNLAPMEGLNIGVRFETLTAMEVENDTEVDSTGMFPDGAKTNSDMPAMLGLGVSYMIMENLKAEVSFNYYMNTGVGRFDDIMDGLNPFLAAFGLPELTIDDFVEDTFEFGVGIEYGLSEALKVSAGFLTGPSGRKDMFMTDLDFGLASSSVGFGAAYKVSENLGLNVGAVTTMYTEETVEDDAGDSLTFNKSNFGIAIGVNYKL